MLTQEYNFYLEHGYVVIPSSKNIEYKNAINNLYDYYSKLLLKIKKLSSSKVAFRNKNEQPRHIIDLLRDRNSSIDSFIKENHIKKILYKFCDNSKRYYFTHSKLSFKTKNQDASWSPHQDNGYKKITTRKGFAIFVCLEEMNENNGALQVYPDSHRLGTLPHIKVQQSYSGDSQLIIAKEKIPKKYKPKSIKANKGDLVIFSQDCIHQSSQTNSSSRRLAFIFEIEEYYPFVTDDYGNLPIMALGQLNFFEIVLTFLYSYISPFKIWRFLSNYPFIKRLLRKYVLSILGLAKK